MPTPAADRPLLGTTTLLTGASGGIGEAFAHRLARLGSNLVLVARSQPKLETLADRLRDGFDIEVRVVPADLSQPEGIATIRDALAAEDLAIDLLINNAGFGTSGPFVETDGEREHEQVMVNVVAVLDLCHLIAPGMVRRGRGAIINVASTAAFQPMPYMATYAASKAFVLSFSQALHEELKDAGVRVLGLCPGPTATHWFEISGATKLEELSGKIMRTPADVVETALRAVDEDRAWVVDGRVSSIMARAQRLLPPTLIAKGVKRNFQPEDTTAKP